MTDVAVYDADEVLLSFGGYNIDKGAGASGYADGQFVSIEQPTKSFVTKEGTDGTVNRNKTNTRLTIVKVRLMQSSASNAVLSAMLTADEAQPNGAGIRPLVVMDKQGTSKFSADKAWLAGPPNVVYDRESTEREWEIHCVRALRLDGGN